MERRTLARIVRAAEVSDQDTVVEVGAGTGLLTDLLLQRAGKVVAVEVDADLAAGLQDRFGGRGNLAVLEADVLDVPTEEILRQGGATAPFVVVGNLPYSAGSAIVRHFLTGRPQPVRMLVTLQAEVARNMSADPGEMSYLSVEAQYYSEARVLFEIPPRAFRPPPKVTSAVVRLDVRDGAAVEVDDREAFFRLVRAGFASRRKQLRNALAVGLKISQPESEALLTRAGVDSRRRAQTLNLDEWAALYRAFGGKMVASGG